MKKFLILVGILFLVFCGFIVYDTYSVIPMLDIEDDRVNIDKLYVYGTHLNMEGNCSFIDDIELVLYDGEFISYDINDLGIDTDDYDNLIDSSNKDNVVRRFNISNYVNDGIYLDDIPIGDYYMFIRVKDSSDDWDNIQDEDSSSGDEEDKLFYLMSRGIDEDKAKELIVLGFVNAFREELPMEYAVELNRLLSTTIGGV